MDFSGKAVLITGGASGMGAATARAFAEAGAGVAVADLDRVQGRKLAQALASAGRDVAFFETDLGHPKAGDRLVTRTVARFGRLDVLVNSAAVLHRVGTLDTTDRQWLGSMAVNLNAVFFLIRAAARVMKRQGGGAIVNIASEAGLFGIRGGVAYCVSKAGVIQLTRAAALDLAADGIRVNAIAPGAIHTPMLETSFVLRGLSVADGLARRAAAIPLGRLGKPEEIARLVMFLASPDAAYITGTTVSADGGNTAAGPASFAPAAPRPPSAKARPRRPKRRSG